MRIRKIPAMVGLVVVALFLVGIGRVAAFKCRDGMESPIAYVYRERKTCGINQTACFQSLNCKRSYSTVWKDWAWTCFDPKDCKKHADGNSYAYYNGIRGICCFTDNCNAYKLNNCTGDPKHECRIGIENSAGSSFYDANTCDGNQNQTSCFQSLDCKKVADTTFYTFEWSCMDPSKCKRGSDGKSYAYHNKVKGICCDTSNCNAYKHDKCASKATNTGLAKQFALIPAVLLALFY
eukprot:gene7821-8668_t